MKNVGPNAKAIDNKPSKRWILRRVRTTVLILVLFYAGFLLCLVLLEPVMVYPGAGSNRGDYRAESANAEDVWFESRDKTKLHGWYLPRQNSQRTILICHGNAENVALVTGDYGSQLRIELDADIFIFDYRGYGKSDGNPQEAGVIADGLAALDWLCEKTGKQPGQITLYGRSLGGGIAVALANQRGGRELLLDRTFDNLISPGSQRFPWVPVSLLMRNRFPSDERIKSCGMPVFQTHFTDDELIPIRSARNLFFNVTNSQSTFVELPGGHHLAGLPANYYMELRRFIDKLDNQPVK